MVNERLYLSYEFKDFHYKSQSERAVDKVEEYLYANKEEFLVDSVYSFYAENRAGTTIILERADLEDDEVKELRKKIREGLPVMPGVRVFFYEDADQGGDSTFFAVKFFGQDSGTLKVLQPSSSTPVANSIRLTDCVLALGSSSFSSSLATLSGSFNRIDTAPAVLASYLPRTM